METEKLSKLASVDPNYKEYRTRLDEVNREAISKLRSEDHQGGKKSILPLKLSDFTDIKYRMDRYFMGYFIIFCQKTFKKLHRYHESPRHDASFDAKKLEKSMKKLGFKVYRYDDKTTNEIFSLLNQYVSSSSNQHANAFGCAFLSHGEENGQLATYDGFLNAKNIVKETHHGKYLVGKPRLFFFQASRGCRDIDGNKIKLVNNSDDKPLSWPQEADILCHFATTEGYLTYRNRATGSWFIQNLTEVLDKYAHKLEFHHVLLRVNGGIAWKETKSSNGTCFISFMEFINLMSLPVIDWN